VFLRTAKNRPNHKDRAARASSVGRDQIDITLPQWANCDRLTTPLNGRGRVGSALPRCADPESPNVYKRITRTQTADKATRLSPRDPQRTSWFVVAGLASIMLHRDEQAVDFLRRAVTANPNTGGPLVWLAGALGLTGHDAEAREMLQRCPRPTTRRSPRSRKILTPTIRAISLRASAFTRAYARQACRKSEHGDHERADDLRPPQRRTHQ
jgi:hypothetical protein